MRQALCWIGAALFLVLAAGCAADRNFVYKPNSPAHGGPKVPAGVAVLPFGDGTENFTERGSILRRDVHYNLVKIGDMEIMYGLPPPFWGKSFADELAASGSFRSARFVYSISDIKDEAFLVDGTLKKVVYRATWGYPHEILIAFRATRMSDKKVVWEKEVGKDWETPPNLRDGCGSGAKCVASRFQDDWNRGMAAVFAEARADLVATLASLSEGGTAGSIGSKAEGRPAESAEQTIDRILKGK